MDIERLKTDPAYWDEVAPEGATHFNPNGMGVWFYKYDCGVWLYWSETRREWAKSRNPATWHVRLMGIPQWRGPEDGLPPVESRVVVAISPERLGSGLGHFSGAEVRIAGHFVAHGGGSGVVIDHPYKGIGAMMYRPEFFRPLKSDKERAIDAAVAATILKDGPRIRSALSDIYDAGLLRLPEDTQ